MWSRPVESTVMDRRWHLVLDCLGADWHGCRPRVAEGTLATT